MDLDMLQHPATRKNIETLKSFGNIIIEPEDGELASGLVGKGRMKEPTDILQDVIKFFDSKKKLKNKRILVTAGPTYESIDPVRFIGNHSSGKMGYAIAEELANQGAEVELISGPVKIKTSHKNIRVTKVFSAQEMYENAIKIFPNCDAAIMNAAVADYTPKETTNQKIKEKTNSIQLELIPTKDIALELGKMKKTNQILIGFALETNNEIENAKNKIQKKNLDFIVLNSLNDNGAGFNHDTNKITIIDKNNNIESFELKSKPEVAKDIVSKLNNLLFKK